VGWRLDYVAGLYEDDNWRRLDAARRARRRRWRGRSSDGSKARRWRGRSGDGSTRAKLDGSTARRAFAMTGAGWAV
jgi:hypothetical protein